MKKRIFASLLAVLMVLSVVAFTPAFAEEEASDKLVISAEVAKVTKGAAEAEVIISVKNIPEAGLASVRFTVKAEGLSITEGTANKDLPETGYAVVGPTPAESVMFMWVDVSTGIKEDTELVAFKVALPTDAACKTEFPISIVISDDPDDFIAIDSEAVPAEGKDGAIVIEHALTKVDAVEATPEADGNIEYWKCDSCGKFFNEAGEEITAESVVVKYEPAFTPGDVDGNGKLNAKDVTAIMKHLVGKTPANFNADAADFDGNGKINAKDVTGLMKYLVQNPS